jgi:hypothetical protein
MRRHAAGVLEAVKLNERGAPTDEQRRNYKAILVASFNDAQSAWDSYREHLIEHGLLPERP